MRYFFAVVTSLAFVIPLDASVIFADRARIELTDPTTATQFVQWGSTHQPLMGGRPGGLEIPPASLFDITDEGLGWDGDAESSRDAWLLTNPRSIAHSWRPPTRANLSVVVTPGTQRTVTSAGRSYQTYHGTMFARYSADLKTWSSWQLMTHTADVETDTFHVQLGIPQTARVEYHKLLNEYQQLDVPWTCDESAAARWIDTHHPEFFDTEIPYLGYVQVLYETQLRGDGRLKALDLEWGWAVSGLHSPPRDKSAYETERNWWDFDRTEAVPAD